MSLKSLFGFEKPYEDSAFSLYGAIVAQARQPFFYSDLGVLDTVEGRYDMMIMHAFLLFNRMREEGEEARKLNQVVFDTMFKDIDQSLREMGVGDMGVGPRIKKMAASFFGRVAAYTTALQSDDSEELRQAIARNVFNKTQASDLALDHLAAYMRDSVTALERQNTDDIMSGVISYVDPETIN